MPEDDSSGWNRRDVLKTTGAIGVAAGFGGVASATPGREPGAKEDEVLVGVSKATIESKSLGGPKAAVERLVPGNARVVHENEELSYVAVKFPAQAPDVARENFIEAVTKKEGVKYAEMNETYEATMTPNDPRFGDQYAPQMVNAPTAWDTTTGSSGVTVAVVDTGAQYSHPDLQGNYASDPGYDFADDDSDPAPDAPSDEYHGTHVSGIAASAVDNGTGVAGQGDSTLINGRALDETGRGSTADIADAVQWAADRGADVINLSLGGGGYTSTMANAVSYATNNGALVVAAAGNDGNTSDPSVDYPAKYSECLAVSALDESGGLAYYSNYGSEIELAAPGSNVLSTTTEARGSYEELSGTSMAAPVVAGVAGLTLSQWDLTNAELRSHLKNTAVDVGLSSNQQGSGRVDAANAVTTEPGSGDGGGGGDDGGGGGGSGSTSGTVNDSLAGYYDSACYSWSWEYDSPSQVVLELSGPSDADFDLYASDGTGSCPTTSSYDYRSYTADSQETITVDAPDTSTELHVLVDSYSGSGSFSLTITEYE